MLLRVNVNTLLAVAVVAVALIATSIIIIITIIAIINDKDVILEIENFYTF